MIDSIEHQSNSAQDMVKTGNDWIVICDGHGKGSVIDYLRTVNWDDVVNYSNPIDFLNNNIRKLGDTTGDGSTLSIVRIDDKGINCAWIGDSQIRIYADREEIWRSSNHSRENIEESKNHLSRGGNIINKTWAVKVLDANTITMERSQYYEFPGNPDVLAMSRALGHNEIYHPVTEFEYIPFSTALTAKHWKIVVGSDGLWDVICKEDNEILSSPEMKASDLGELALLRWNQEWNYKHPPPHTSCSSGERISNNIDDICIGVWQI